MPELPEVETLRLGLQKYLVGHKIVKVNVIDRKLFEGVGKDVVGATFTDVKRYAKGIVINLSNSYSIAVHIKLTGQLIFRDSKTKNLAVLKPTPQTVPNKFTRVIFTLDKKCFLYFQEVRGFAWMKVIKTDQLKELPFFKSLGPEPFVGQASSGQALLTLDFFRKIVSSSNIPIKSFLMDQKKIGGIGNIYANDACWDAHIDPGKRAKELSQKEIDTLYKSILKVLTEGLKYKGSSELNFVDVLGNTGEYQNHVLVYGRKGKECRRGDGIIKKIYLGGRGTYFCPACQA